MTSRYPPPPDGNVPWLDEPVERSDPRAFHDDEAGEFGGVEEKTSPVSADLIVIEDSAASNVKKRVQLGNIPTSQLAGSWTTWTPTYTNLTIGNGTVVARYTQIGKTVHVYFEFTLGSTSAVGSAPLITTPVTHRAATYTVGDNVIGVARYDETGVAARGGTVRLQTTTQFRPIAWSATATFTREANLSSTAPFTWGATDVLQFTATYEAA